jgi:hypothetical protein
MTDEEEMKIRDLFDQKISEIHDSVFGECHAGEVSLTHPLMKVLAKRWRKYIQSLGISFMSADEAYAVPRQKWHESGRFKISNPFYADKKEFRMMDMSLDTAEKILLLGLP